MGFAALAKKGTPENHSPTKGRPNHFPITPFLKPPPSQPTTQKTIENRFSRVTTDSGASGQSTWRKDRSAHRPDSQATTSIYESFTRPSLDNRALPREPVVEIDDKSNKHYKHSDLLSPVHSDRHRGPSRSSSLDGLSNPPSIYSPASTTTDLTDIPDLHLRLHRTPLDAGYESSSSAHHGGRRHRNNVRAQMMNAEVLEEHADEDKLSAHHLNTIRGRNKSANSVVSKIKADRILGMAAPTTSLVSAYVCSGLGLLPEAWSLADSDAIRGIQPSEDAMGMFWRPEVLHNAFSGDTMAELFSAGQHANGTPIITDVHPSSLVPDGRIIPDAGPQASKLIVAKCLKAAHPKDVEVINSPTCPPSTCHTFSFTLPRHDTLAAIARTRLNAKLPPGVDPTQAAYNAGFMDSQVGLDARGYHGSARPEQIYADVAASRAVRETTEIRYYGVTVLTWYHADEKRHDVLSRLLHRLSPDGQLARPASMRSVRSSDLPLSVLGQSSVEKPKRRRLKVPWSTSRTPSESGNFDTVSEADTHFTDREPDTQGPLARLGIKVRKAPPKYKKFAQLQQAEYGPKVLESGDVFWIPVAHTLVSRHPIYDTMLDFLRLDIGKFAKDAYWHNVNVLRLLNTATPRPGELYRLRVGTAPDDDIALEAYMPGAVDFEKGIVKVDYQLWPLFQAVDLDHILICIDVAMSQTGRIILTSKYSYMLSVAVNTLKYILDLRGWDGIAIPIVHARDTPLVVEDPGPYIIGLPSEFKALVTAPPEVVFIDLDTSSLVCKKLPVVVTPKARRDKAKARLAGTFGSDYSQTDRSVPIDFKHLNRLKFPSERKPKYVGQAMSPPSWWRQTEIMTALDKIMANKHKKPTLIQRITRSGINRAEAQLSVGEQVAKVMMRRRALHYVESRDELEIKIAKVNARLASIAVDGRFWRNEFHKFESYATQLAVHTERLRVMIDREKQDTKRYSHMAAEQTKARTDLEVKLQATEDARAEAMRQLSDMHHSIQELEREREQIMDVFEDQLNSALETIPETAPQSPDQLESALPTPLSPQPHKTALPRSRPTSRDTDMSTLSRLTVLKPASVRGSVRQAAVPSGGVTTSLLSGEGFDGRAFERSEYVSHRIASIQAKLELALTTSTVRSTSAPIGLATVQDEDAEGDSPRLAEESKFSPTQPTRLISALPSNDHSPKRASLSNTTVNRDTSPTPRADRKRPASIQVASANLESIGDTTFGEGSGRAGALTRLLGKSTPVTPERPHHHDIDSHVGTPSSTDGSLSRRNSLMKPGVTYRIRPKRQSMTSTSGYQSTGPASALGDNVPEIDTLPPLVQHARHDKFPTSSTDSDGLQTPSASVLDHVTAAHDSSVVRMAADGQPDEGLLGLKRDEEEDLAKRLSAISTTTVTFGQ